MLLFVCLFVCLFFRFTLVRSYTEYYGPLSAAVSEKQSHRIGNSINQNDLAVLAGWLATFIIVFEFDVTPSIIT